MHTQVSLVAVATQQTSPYPQIPVVVTHQGSNLYDTQSAVIRLTCPRGFAQSYAISESDTLASSVLSVEAHVNVVYGVVAVILLDHRAKPLVLMIFHMRGHIHMWRPTNLGFYIPTI